MTKFDIGTLMHSYRMVDDKLLELIRAEIVKYAKYALFFNHALP